MTMKTRYIVGLFLVGASVLSSCSDFTEIDQKGMNLLSTTDQLEMLLNQEYNIRIADNIFRLCVPEFVPIPAVHAVRL